MNSRLFSTDVTTKIAVELSRKALKFDYAPILLGLEGIDVQTKAKPQAAYIKKKAVNFLREQTTFHDNELQTILNDLTNLPDTKLRSIVLGLYSHANSDKQHDAVLGVLSLRLSNPLLFQFFILLFQHVRVDLNAKSIFGNTVMHKLAERHDEASLRILQSCRR